MIVSDMTNYSTELSTVFHALADPTRRAILSKLCESPAQVTELSQPTGLRLPTVMRHLSVLEEAGLITSRKEGRVRVCALVPDAFEPARSWLDEQRSLWEGRLDRLEAMALKAKKEEKK